MILEDKTYFKKKDDFKNRIDYHLSELLNRKTYLDYFLEDTELISYSIEEDDVTKDIKIEIFFKFNKNFSFYTEHNGGLFDFDIEKDNLVVKLLSTTSPMKASKFFISLKQLEKTIKLA